MRCVKCVLAVIGVILVTAPIVAQADPIDPPPGVFPGLALKINEHGQGPPEWVNPPGQQIAQNRWNYKGTHTKPGRYTIEFDIDADPDPFLHATLTLVRHQPGPQSFTISIILPDVTPIPGNTLTGGSVSGSLMDSGGGGAELSLIPAGDPLYMSKIDDNDHVALMVNLQTVIVPAFQTAVLGPESFGTPIPSLLGPPVNSTIEIVINTRVSGLDTATIQASFVVIVPEPATMVMLSIGAVGMLLRRRRR